MADWYGNARSNYVYLKPGAKSALWDKYEGYVDFSGHDDGRIALISRDGYTPTSPEGDESLLDVIQHHLEPGETFIWIEIGAEKARYLTGTATAITSEGILKTVDLNDIYRDLSCSRAEY